MIDLLKRGNLELFHSSMIAWMLSPSGEHGWGHQFLEGFLRLAGVVAPANWGGVKVQCECPGGSFRYDIKLDFQRKPQVVIENKAKTIGGQGQLDGYHAQGFEVIALGFCDESFDKTDPLRRCVKGMSKSYPLVTYGEILELLKAIYAPCQSDPWSHLIGHYIDFLKCELGMLEKAINLYSAGNQSPWQPMKLPSCRDKFDVRFLHKIFCAKFKRFLIGTGGWGLPQDISFGDRSDTFFRIGNINNWIGFGPSFTGLKGLPLQYDLGFNLPDGAGILSTVATAQAGTLQLCAQPRDNTFTSQNRTAVVHHLRAGLKRLQCTWVKPGTRNGKTFTVAKAVVHPDELVHDRLESRLRDFVNVFRS